MKILSDRSQLQEAFSLVAGIAPQKTPKPILQNILVEADDDGLSMFATDYEISAKVTVDSVKVQKPGKMLLPAKETSALLRELNEPTLTLESKEYRCTIESGGGSFVLVGDDPEQFPSEAQIGEGETITLPAHVFLPMVRKTIFAAAREESRYMINGVLFDSRDDCLRLVATDGRRLALNYFNLPGGKKNTPEIKSVVPIRALHMLTKAISEDSTGDLEITFTENQVGFRFQNMSLISQLLECNFPDYDVVIPKAAETSCEINRDLLERNVRKVAVLSSGDLRIIRMNFGSQSLELSAESSGVGRADQVMDVDVKGAGGILSFNPDYLLEALKVTDLEVLRLDMSDDSTPAKMTLGESFTYILMPISGS
jgi:DNA polymerase III subunit beta